MPKLAVEQVVAIQEVVAVPAELPHEVPSQCVSGGQCEQAVSPVDAQEATALDPEEIDARLRQAAHILANGILRRAQKRRKELAPVTSSTSPAALPDVGAPMSENRTSTASIAVRRPRKSAATTAGRNAAKAALPPVAPNPLEKSAGSAAFAAC